MEIIATIRQFKTEKDIEITYARIKSLYNIGIKNYRISIVDFDENNINSAMNLCSLIKTRLKDCDIFIDLSFPYRKARIIETFDNKPFTLEKNEEILMYTNASNIKSKKYIKVNIANVDCFSNIIEYSDGEGTFSLIKRISNTCLLLKANDTIKIYNKKSLKSNQHIASYITDDNLEKLKKLLEFNQINKLFFSFVSNYNDLEECKKYFKEFYIIPKIETLESIQNIDLLCKNSDGLYLARGDLGLNIEQTNFVECCNDVINTAKLYDKVLIIGTDILDSLAYRNTPSRSDIVDLTYIVQSNPNYIVLNGNVITSNRIEIAVNTINKFTKNMK